MVRATYLTLAEIAERADVGEETMRVYHKRANRNRRTGKVRPGDLPEPDITLGRTPGWSERAVTRWLESRPGRGAKGAAKDRQTGVRGRTDPNGGPDSISRTVTGWVEYLCKDPLTGKEYTTSAEEWNRGDPILSTRAHTTVRERLLGSHPELGKVGVIGSSGGALTVTDTVAEQVGPWEGSER